LLQNSGYGVQVNITEKLLSPYHTAGSIENWSDIIFKQRAAKKAKISEAMSLVADKYSENDPVPSVFNRRPFRNRD
jgi:hypothetical protein